MTTSRSFTIGATLTVAAFAVLGVLAAWQIYASGAFLLIVLLATAIGMATATLARRGGWQWWVSAAVLLGAFLVLSAAFAVPTRWADGDIAGAVTDVLAGPVTGWKDLITSPLPVGTYRNLLVPAVVVFLVAPFAAQFLALRDDAAAAFAVVPAAVPAAFGLLFGRTSTSSPLHLGPLTIAAPVETLIGAAGVLLGIGWLSWRAREQRRQALRRAAEGTGVRAARRRSASAVLRRGTITAAMLLVAVVVGSTLAPTLLAPRTRDVLRSAIGPDLSQTEALSPLATFRQNDADSAYNTVLFTLTSDDDLPARIRIATLDDYDGEVYRTPSDGAAAFTRVPSVLDTPPGVESTVTFTIEAQASVWLPTFGSLASIAFAGVDAADMADRFYYDADTGTAVEAGGTVAGQEYAVTAVVPDEPSLAGQASPGAASSITPPQSLRTWVDSLGVSRDGDGLLSAIETLRDRGYLSHALSIDEADPPDWMKDLDDYAFRSSAAGHSLARIDTLFTQLLERETQVDDTGDGSLVAAVGDDEQFAVAAALIAQYLGFPARVVVGVRTADAELALCQDGVCTGADVTAWIEVGTAEGWTSVDVTPQHTAPVETTATRQRDPENMTDVRPDTAQAVAPPDPEGAESEAQQSPAKITADLTPLWGTLRWVGIAALGVVVLFGPFLFVIIAKVLRRRRRKYDPDAARAIAGGWEEYVDTAVDGGRPAPGTLTRSEVAAAYGTPRGGDLAVLADRAVFSDGSIDGDEAAEFWNIVDTELHELRAGTGWWRRVRAALSLTSFTRHLSRRGTERGGASSRRRVSS